MNRERKRRISFIIFLLMGLSLTSALVLYALRQNVNLYYTPTQLISAPMSSPHLIRLGGVVEKGSLHYGTHNLKVNFLVTDFSHHIKVYYDGILPALFREGQGIVAQGMLNKKGHFMATEVLAKHDANYRPPLITSIKDPK